MAAIPPNVKHRCKHRLLECPANQLRSSCGVPADKLLRNHAHATQLYSNPNPAIRSLEDDVAPVRRNECFCLKHPRSPGHVRKAYQSRDQSSRHRSGPRSRRRLRPFLLSRIHLEHRGQLPSSRSVRSARSPWSKNGESAHRGGCRRGTAARLLGIALAHAEIEHLGTSPVLPVRPTHGLCFVPAGALDKDFLPHLARATPLSDTVQTSS